MRRWTLVLLMVAGAMLSSGLTGCAQREKGVGQYWKEIRGKTAQVTAGRVAGEAVMTTPLIAGGKRFLPKGTTLYYGRPWVYSPRSPVFAAKFPWSTTHWPAQAVIDQGVVYFSHLTIPRSKIRDMTYGVSGGGDGKTIVSKGGRGGWGK